MREVKVSVPQGLGHEVASLAIAMGNPSISLHTVYNPARSQNYEEIKIKTSTPKARLFIDRLTRAPFYQAEDCVLSSHDIRSLSFRQDIGETTKPFCMPTMDVYEDLWQAIHITPSFIVRVVVSAMLLTYGMLQNRVILMIGAMLFTVFSPPLMALGLGVPLRDKKIIMYALASFGVANVLSIVAAAIVAGVVGGPLLWDDFGGLAGNVFVAIGASVAGAIADTDDAGRRQLIAIAAAFPYSRFPPWIGISLVLGFPSLKVTLYRLAIFGLNIGAMIVSSAITYRLLRLRRPIV